MYWIGVDSIFSALGQPEDGARPTGRFDKGGLLADVTTPSDVSPRHDTLSLLPSSIFQDYHDSPLNASLRYATCDTTHERSRPANRTRRSNQDRDVESSRVYCRRSILEGRGGGGGARGCDLRDAAINYSSFYAAATPK